MNSVTLTLPIPLTNGNTGRGHAFWNSAKRRKEYEVIIRDVWRKAGSPKVATPCRIHVTRVLGKGQSLWDADSCLRGSAKEKIDAMVAVGIIPDDGPKHVTEVTASQDATRRADGPITIISITSSEEKEA